ncbi:universal stress protein [Cocleimonas sp. KMM 6892]|uniref:universal stress protein n=1 Tax=unclassified Cocleimonas TaxID=2639732 RepID=UPI002DBF55F0|nr:MULTISPECIES: universal stress protein [unclassified Cocleimonas]MEB8431271.1 universal stress protein [Cocleimonas sp. KMM 6892]MEC4713957.1 universal stress protein [Cocleimonas sp. KMM 6895]MEC4743288.1 universal stress protein [Cocleimonas sp. KMM 6896]
MSIKDILVFLDDSAGHEDRVNAAFDISKAHEAHLTGASLASMKPIHAKSDNEEVLIRISDKQAHKIADEFAENAEAEGINVESLVINGGASKSALKMAHYARNADLVILGQPDPSRDNFSRLEDFSQEVILHSGRPILFMPYIGTRRVGFKKAMIAWDGTPAASRAIHDSIPLLAKTKEVFILIVESKKQKEQKNNLMEKRLIKHLSHHEINAKLMRVNPGSNNVPTTILNKISEYDVDLLVIGGYGTPTLKQKIFGSVSTILLKSMIVPVLMSH